MELQGLNYQEILYKFPIPYIGLDPINVEFELINILIQDIEIELIEIELNLKSGYPYVGFKKKTYSLLLLSVIALAGK